MFCPLNSPSFSLKYGLGLQAKDSSQCSVFFQVMVHQVQPQEETQERHKKTKVTRVTGPRELVTTCCTGSRELATFWSDGTRQKSADSIRPETLLGFPWEERARTG